MELEHSSLMPLIKDGKEEISEKQGCLEDELGLYGELVSQQEEQSDLVQKSLNEEEALQTKYQSSIRFYEDEIKGKID